MAQITGARYLAETLEAYGITHNFMVPAVLRRTLAEMERRTRIVSIHTHGEKPAAYMADGYARAARRPGLCMAQEVGVLNLAAGLRDAWLAHSPVIALTGGKWTRERYKRLYQDAEDLPALNPYTKMNVTIDDVSRIPDLLRQAFRTATTGTPGPVHLQFAGQEGELDREEADLAPFAEETFAAIPAYRLQPDPAALQAAWKALSKAKQPVIVVGGGAKASGAGEAICELSTSLGIPIATSLNGRDCVPDTHPLNTGVVGTYSRKSANRLLAESDLVIFAGSETGSMTTNFWRLPPTGVKTIQIDVNPEAMGRNYSNEVSILADVKLAIEGLKRISGGHGGQWSRWVQKAVSYRDEAEEENRPVRTSEAQPIRPERICGELSSALPDDAVVVVDTGHAGMWMSAFFDLKSPNQSYIRSCGHLGWAFPAGLGAKCAVPKRPVVTFTGDLGLWYHIGEIETAVRWDIAAVTVVNNNHSGNQSQRGFNLAYEGKATERSKDLWVHREVNFARIAEEIGALGIRVEKPADLRPAIEKAIESKRPAIVDVVTDIEAAAPLAWDASDWVQKY